MSIALELIQKTQTLEKGRQLSNSNDEALAAGINALAIPAHTHVQSDPATTWTVAHGKGTKILFWNIKDASDRKMHAAIEDDSDPEALVLTFTENATGSCDVFVGNSNATSAPNTEIGLPTDGIWGLEDGGNPAGLLEDDALKDALDKINTTIAQIAPAPEVLQGNLVVDFLTDFAYETARIASGSGQNLTNLSAGDSCATVVISDAIELKTPSAPATQFGRADLGTLDFLQDTNVIDTIDLGTEFDEGERNLSSGQTWPAGYVWNKLKVNSVAKHLNVPFYQKGDFSVFLQSYLLSGENADLSVRHTVDATEYQTNPLTLFYDNGSLPVVTANSVKLLQLVPGAYKYLDGIRYYKQGATFSVCAKIENLANRTFKQQPLQLGLSGATTKLLNWNASSVAITKDANFLDDAFTGGTIDATKWTASSGVTQSGSITVQNASPGASVNRTLTSNTYVVKNSEFDISVDLKSVSHSNGGIQAGIKLVGASGGSIEFLYHLNDDNATETMEVYYTPDGGSRTLHGTRTQALVLNTTVAKIHIVNTVENTYVFNYRLNGLGAIFQVGSDLVFDDWAPVNTFKLKPILFGANSFDTNLPSFNVNFDNFAISGGRAISLDEFPDVADYFEILAETYALNQSNVDTIQGQATVIPLSARGTGLAVSSALQDALISTSSTSKSTATIEYFTDNQYRLPIAAYNIPPVANTGNWTDTSVIANGNAQITGGKLVYPSIDYTTYAMPVQQGGTDYSGFTGNQIYERAIVPAGPKSSGTLKLGGITSAQFLANAISIDLKLPALTGWLSLNSEFSEYEFAGADADGCRTSASDSEGFCLLGFTFGSYSTGNSSEDNNGIAIVRITLPGVNAPKLTYMELVDWELAEVPDPDAGGNTTIIEHPVEFPLEIALSAPSGVQTSAIEIGYDVLSAGTYFYKIVAVDIDGNFSLPSNEVQQAIVGGPTEDTVHLEWDAVPGAVSYRIYGRDVSDNQDIYFETADVTFDDVGDAGTAGTVSTTTEGKSLLISETETILPGQVKIVNTISTPSLDITGTNKVNLTTGSLTDDRAVTFPNEDGEIVLKDAAQELTNKTTFDLVNYGNLELFGQFGLKTETANVSADVNNAVVTYGGLRINASVPVTYSGFVPVKDNQIIIIFNVGAQNVTISNQDTNSSANNRVITGTGASIVLAPDESMTLWYDGTTFRWRVLK